MDLGRVGVRRDGGIRSRRGVIRDGRVRCGGKAIGAVGRSGMEEDF